jgi:hypothetical protein
VTAPGPRSAGTRMVGAAEARQRPGRGAWLPAALLALVVATLLGCDDGVVEVAVVMGGTLEVAPEVTRHGWLVVLDGDLVVARGALVRGSVVVLGGGVRLDGRIDGDVIALSGAVQLGAGAHVLGDLAAAGDLLRAPGARVDGRVSQGDAVPETFAGLVRAGPSSWPSVFGRAGLLALLGLLATRFAPAAVGRLREVVRRHALTAAALGALAFVVGSVLLVVMAFTVVLIPVSLAGLVVGLVTLMVGWSAVGIALGTGLANRWRGSPSQGGASQRLAAALGVFAVVAALGALERSGWLGALVALGVTVVGLGAVLLTGFGTRRFVPDTSASEPGPGP